jgi:hypothetical protein
VVERSDVVFARLSRRNERPRLEDPGTPYSPAPTFAHIGLHRTERDYARLRTFIGARSLRTVGLGDLLDFAACDVDRLGRDAPANALSTKALQTTGFKTGALRFNAGTVLRLPKAVSRWAERRHEEVELFRLLAAVEKKPPDHRALYVT